MLPEVPEAVAPCSQVFPRSYWEALRDELGMICSAYDLFMKYCLSAAGECYSAGNGLTGKFLCCMSKYYPGDTKPPILTAEKYECNAGEIVQLFIECGVPTFTWTTTGGTVAGMKWHAPYDEGGDFIIEVTDACGRSSQITITVIGPPDPLPPGRWGNQIIVMAWDGYRGFEAGMSGYSAEMGWPLKYAPPAGWYHIPAALPPNGAIPEQWLYHPANTYCFGPYYWTIINTVNKGWYGAENCLTGTPRSWNAIAYPVATRWVPDE
ncbi:hypothetical protein ES707_08088 [subsurface metagenome]